ncbi:MAG: DUF721 domain-containing protein [Chitinispirillaceae bacterium]|nr:DUF721 domain-containing protein [Chitinispirillaceae bacterium]
MASPEKIGNILENYLSERGYLSICKEYNVVSMWKDIVGDKIASISKCVNVEDGILYVSVESSAWRLELSFLKKEILSKIKEKTNCQSIKDIVFL